MASSNPPLSHILFVDDSILFCKATEGEVDMVNNILDLYEKGLGQQVNFDKSSLFFSTNFSQGARDCLARRLNIPHGQGFWEILGTEI
ncbi:hypothetical protein CerSpe_169990 [Prunus speciosa]